MENAPLGIRNNNPGNLRPVGKETGFQKFESMEDGIVAAAKNLQGYVRKGYDTVEKIINRWAPPKENDTGSYVKSVAAKIGVSAGDKLNLKDPRAMKELLKAIFAVENGAKHAKRISEDTIIAALKRVGLEA